MLERFDSSASVVKFVLATRKEAILLPTESVQLGQNGYFAFVVGKDNKAELRIVELGERYGESVPILSGIKPEDTVVLQGQINLSPGVAVKVVPENKSAPTVKPSSSIKTALPKVTTGKTS